MLVTSSDFLLFLGTRLTPLPFEEEDDDEEEEEDEDDDDEDELKLATSCCSSL